MSALAKTGNFYLAPSSFSEAKQFAELIAQSDLAPKDYRGKPGNIIVAMSMGADVGLSPMQSLSSIAVINGKAALYGDALIAIVQASPDYEDIEETVLNGVATCIVKRRNRTPTTRTFSRDDAKKAGLLGKQGPWTQYENRMLQMRARAFALRDAFADVLRGLQMAEEVQDYEVRATVVENPRGTTPAPHAPNPQLPAPSQARGDTVTSPPDGPRFPRTWKHEDGEWASRLMSTAGADTLSLFLEDCDKADRTIMKPEALANLDASIKAAEAALAALIDAETGEVRDPIADKLQHDRDVIESRTKLDPNDHSYLDQNEASP
jgi:hypothetical protein